MLLDSKSVMDNAMPELHQILQLIPSALHERFHRLIESFEDTLCECDVSGEYTEIERTR